MPESIRVERDGPVVTITLNRPERRNALDGSVVAELRAAVAPLAEDPDLRVLVLRADGPVFCGGANVSDPDRPGFTPEPASWSHRRHEAGRFQRLLTELDGLPAVTVAAAQGWVIGGGFLLALTCDIRLAHRDARFSLAELRFGLPITGSGAQRLAREVGISRAREILLTGRRVDAVEAAEIGLVHRVSDDLDEAVSALTGELLAIPAPAQAITKRAMVALGNTAGLDLAWADPDIHAWAAAEASVVDAVIDAVATRYSTR